MTGECEIIMKNGVFDVVLLVALPASGKSEVRNFMANIEPERLQREFHIGENLQLDDFPYVHMMRRIDNELEKMDSARNKIDELQASKDFKAMEVTAG